MNPVTEAQLRHRSIRQYSGKPIEESLLVSLIQSAQGAASSSFVQAYSLVQVSSSETRAKIAALAGGQKWIESAAEFLVICADLSRVEYCCEQQGMPFCKLRHIS